MRYSIEHDAVAWHVWRGARVFMTSNPIRALQKKGTEDEQQNSKHSRGLRRDIDVRITDHQSSGGNPGQS